MFFRSYVDVVILENGIGGRLDATNATNLMFSVITQIDFDHGEWLETRSLEIASEKAGIIKPRIPLLLRAANPIPKGDRARAVECQAPLQFVTESTTARQLPCLAIIETERRGGNRSLRAAKIDVDNSTIARAPATIDGQRVFKGGITAQLLMARITQPRRRGSRDMAPKFLRSARLRLS